MPSSPPPLDFFIVLSESKRIISAHSRHFLALSVLFLLPLSFTTTIYSTLINSHSHSHRTKFLLRHSPTSTLATLLAPLIYSLLALCLSLAALGSITYSVFHGFYGRPVKLLSTIHSLLHSFFPLFLTFLTSQFFQFFFCFGFGLFFFLVIRGIQFLGFEVDYSSPYFVGFCVVGSVCLVLGLLYLQVNWALACVIVVVESSYGFEPLRRSASLVKGMRGLALSLLLFFGFFTGILVWISSMATEGFDDGASNGGKSWVFVLQTVVTTTMVMLLILHSFAANTVLYMYCKAMHGELAEEIVEEFAREYVSLPFDDGKVPHVVSVIST